jgi:serine/threonine-protein kinase
MTRFPAPPDDEYAAIYLEDTDRPLPETINQSTRYAYFKTIARGGKAIIQSCKDLHLSRIICCKKLRPELAENSTEQRRFLREARVSAALQHPNSIPTYEVGRDSRGLYFFTMKLVHGYTLRELLDEKYRERYDLTQLVDVLIQVAHALEYAHSHRVIHRDIKPENILVGPYGEVLLMDWGLAKVWRKDGTADEPVSEGSVAGGERTSSMTGAGQLEGTIAFMSPEQIRKDPEIDYRTDIYSLGVVLFEILARRTPAVGEMVDEMIEQILNVPAPKPSELTSAHVPRLLESITLQCIEKAPDARLQSCGELIRGLQENWAR